MAARDHLRGTLDILVLKTLAWGPRHGYAIARWLEEYSSDVLRVEDGSLYPALYHGAARLDSERSPDFRGCSIASRSFLSKADTARTSSICLQMRNCAAARSVD